jgi:predicted nucleotidyltransferase
VISRSELDEAAQHLHRRFGLVALWLFGSRARGQARPDSDVDLAALFPAEVSPIELFEAATELAHQWGCDVDLIDLSRASPALAMQALRHGELIADHDPSARHRFEGALPTRYEDLRIVRAPIERRIRQRLHG